ncbi:hypothetical protein GCM10010136_05100 [Limoniibacter endophyticus]|uniref:Uncharacterized protein n=1 Tax=Limoniibacter endophyticus TaxID=1565040 RepID=A0A8J3GH08_9HYPH|nr:hypothetical protein GCM10010136_05100 [Limoniibacter endophyticus]
MELGKFVQFKNGAYDNRGIVDGRFVVRYRNRVTGKESYKVWTEEERAKFDRSQYRWRLQDRSSQIYERNYTSEISREKHSKARAENSG